MAKKEGEQEAVRRRKPLSGLDDRDITILQLLVTEAIQAGRGDEHVSNDELARLYALDGKLKNLAETRGLQ